jgi:cytochrome c2
MRNERIPLVLLLIGSSACHRMTSEERRGTEAIARYGCGSCHTIARVPGAAGRVGPPLNGIGNRLYAAGVLLNTPENLSIWVQQPSRVKRTLMPDLGVTPDDAWAIVSYLETLK